MLTWGYKLNYFSWGLVAILLVLIFQLVLNKRFNHDEIESIHTAWKILQGEAIYVDFFQHHHPWFYYLLVPVLAIAGETLQTLFVARLLTFLCFLAILFLGYQFSRRFFDPTTAVTNVVLLLSTLVFVHKGVEIRPDVPQVLFSLGSLLLLFEYLLRKRVLWLCLSAVSGAIAFLFLQKAVFLLLAIALLLLVSAYCRRIHYWDLGLYWLTFLVCLVPYFAYLLWSHTLDEYIFFNWVLNWKFLAREYLGEVLISSYQDNTLMWSFYVLGLLFCLQTRVEGLSTVAPQPTVTKLYLQKCFAAISVGLLLLILITKKQHPQYLLLLIPLVTPISAYGLHILLKQHQRLIATVLVLAILFPIYSLVNDFPVSTQQEQLAKINYVLSITGPEDSVYDGDNAFNLYRKDIDFFWYSLRSGYGLSTYQWLKGYDYDIYKLIEQQQPQVISTHEIKNINRAIILRNYDRSPDYPDLLIRES